MSVQTGFLLRPGALCYPECASDAKASPEHLAAPEDVRTGAVNWTGVFNEFLQSRYNLDVGSPIFSETYASAGPAHRLHHRCTLTVNSADMGLRHVVTGAYCVNGARALRRPSRRSPAHDSALPRRTNAAFTSTRPIIPERSCGPSSEQGVSEATDLRARVRAPQLPNTWSVEHVCSPTFPPRRFAVKAAKKDACRLMLEWFKSREVDPSAPTAPPDVPGRTGQAIEAMLGDAVLKLLLVMHRREHNPSSFPVDPGVLNQWVVRRSTNNFLYQRHFELSRRGELPEGLPPPKGHANADPTAFEAWIARVFRDARGDLRATGETVFPALGVEPATLAITGEDTQSEDSGGAEVVEGAKEAEGAEGAESAKEAEKAEGAEGAESAKEAEGAEGTKEAEGAEGADSKSDERETTSEKPREETESA